MPPVIPLSKSDVTDFARVAVLANTPLSLFTGMVRCSGMDKLRRCPSNDLLAYYNRVTARPGNCTEIVAGVAYAVLFALILQMRETPNIQVDASRLQWGERVLEFATRSNIGTSQITLSGSTPAPRISTSSSPSARTIFPLYGADGQPLPWRNLT